MKTSAVSTVKLQCLQHAELKSILPSLRTMVFMSDRDEPLSQP